MDNMEIRYRVDTKINPGAAIEQNLLTKEMDNNWRNVSRWIAQTRDKGFREGLIALGWTPPNDGYGDGR